MTSLDIEDTESEPQKEPEKGDPPEDSLSVHGLKMKVYMLVERVAGHEVFGFEVPPPPAHPYQTSDNRIAAPLDAFAWPTLERGDVYVLRLRNPASTSWISERVKKDPNDVPAGRLRRARGP